MVMSVYRAFDCYDEDARAPTPLPPLIFTGYADGGGSENVPEETSTTAAISSSSISVTEPLKVDGEEPSPKKHKSTATQDRESSTSPLSDYPSDLSEWDMSDKVRRTASKTAVFQLTEILDKE